VYSQLSVDRVCHDLPTYEQDPFTAMSPETNTQSGMGRLETVKAQNPHQALAWLNLIPWLLERRRAY